MKVWSPAVGKTVKFKFDYGLGDGSGIEVDAVTTVANGWEELTFDYSAINTANSYDRIVMIFELGTPGDGTANFTFLMDDLRLH